MAKAIGIMGGTFNPIHIGHLVLAEEAMCAFCLDKIVFIPNGIPPHRQGEVGIVEAEDRYIMVNLAIASNPKFFPSRIELDRPGPSYTLDTLQELKRIHPEIDLLFITGVDSILKDTWRGFDELLDFLKYFIAATRPGFDETQLEARKKELNLTRGDRIKLLQIPEIDISSSAIRKRIREGRSVKYFIPEDVESFIKKKRLYII